jgi:plastocyanin
MSVVRAALVVFMLIASACGGASESTAGDDAAAAADDTATAAPSEEPTAVVVRPPVPVQGMSVVRAQADATGSANVDVEIEADEGDAAVPHSSFDPNLIKVDPGATVNVRVTNTGDTDHNVSVTPQKIDIMLAPGKSKMLRLKMPADAGLRFYCNLHAPMVGAFYSEDGQTIQG